MFEYKDCLSKVDFKGLENELVFIDVGCNINPTSTNFILDDFTELVQAIYPKSRCIGIEPLHWQSYEDKWKNNSNVSLVKKALSNTNENKDFYVPSAHGLSSLIDRQVFHTWGKEKLPKKVLVECITLDSLINDLRVDYIHYLKIDTEGSEYNIILGSKKLLEQSRIRYIQMEYGCLSDAGVSISKMDSYLEQYGYKRIHMNQTEILYAFGKYED